jgi:hypothetical protein
MNVTVMDSETEAVSFWRAVTLTQYVPATWSPLKLPLVAPLKPTLPLDEAANVKLAEAVVPLPSFQVALELPELVDAKLALALAET